MNSYASYFATFLSGVAVGAAGQYFADKYTDRRREQESRRAAEKRYRELATRMPAIFREMRADLVADDSGAVREFFVLPTPGVMIGFSDKARFRYNESEHSALRESVDLLVEAGFVDDLTGGGAPKFRMSEAFVAALKADKRAT